ncbi:MAG: 50S ribosomal protein L25 [Gemmatimonadetes bacterium]|jgi:large subunit ribosomal protein L25|nr:50S ribosomal protein L25 [Gemmatimonadota bacterium]MBP6669060.1 50S ribosomal protein L25 [Gemmatimonadales bacterium]MBK6778686.1 50S ribosomal protein L25 [Gemmatimonadota bacterium]MBK7349005.1 50S ribosomal protein L25 [Gemmatimonadota bacterium]MBK7714566.1 50S ribosomal protein L25 [Gemmatimonadota bacterium]
MATAALTASRRTDTGKGVARSLRRDGRIPAVIYGHNRAPEALALESAAFGRLLSGISAGSTILDVTVDGQAPVKALIREIQRHPLRATDILHVDLYEVSANEKVTLEVPVHLVGTSDGVRNFGGILDQVLHKLQIRVFPGDIPGSIDVDVTTLGIGKSIFVRDVKLAKGEILNEPTLPVCSCVAPRTEETTVAPTAEAPTEPELIRKAKPEEGEAAEKA